MLSTHILLLLFVCDVSTGVNITGTKDVKLGDKNYVLHCHTHHGEASVEWKALNTALPVDSCSSLPPHAAESGQACTKTHKGRTTLKFMVITLQSVGQFSCRGKDKLGNVVASKNVTVSPSPIPTHDLLTAMRIRGTQHRRDEIITSKAGDTPTSGAAREEQKGGDSIQVALIVALICVTFLMTAFWLYMVMIYCRRRCGQKINDQESNAIPQVQKL